MTQSAFSLNVFVALLKRAERGEVIDPADLALVEGDEGLEAGVTAPVLMLAMRFLRSYVARQDTFQGDPARKTEMMEQAAAHVMQVEARYEDAL